MTNAIQPEPAEHEVPNHLAAAVTGQWLMAQNFPPTVYVVDGIIPEGFTMLSAAPKIGKSWQVLGLAIAAATGGNAYGCIPVARRPVLYLALEDGLKRLQRRVKAMGVDDLPAGLQFITEIMPGQNFLDVIQAFLECHRDSNPLIIVDTLGKVMPPPPPGMSAYQSDYRVSGRLRAMTGAFPGAALIVVHHTRKASSEDFLESSSGTNGITGGADTILVLQRKRGESEALLHVTSRDAAEGSYAMIFDQSRCQWELTGSSLTEAAAAARDLKATGGLSDDMTELITLIGKYPDGIRRKDIADLVHFEEKNLGTYLQRATERGSIVQIKRGLYGPVLEEMTTPLDPGSWESEEHAA